MSKPHPAVPGPVEAEGVSGWRGGGGGRFLSRREGVRVGVEEETREGEDAEEVAKAFGEPTGYGVGDRWEVTRKGEGGLWEERRKPKR